MNPESKHEIVLRTAIWDGASFDDWSTDFLKAIVCMVLAGPLLTGYTQVGDLYSIPCIAFLTFSSSSALFPGWLLPRPLPSGLQAPKALPIIVTLIASHRPLIAKPYTLNPKP